MSLSRKKRKQRKAHAFKFASYIGPVNLCEGVYYHTLRGNFVPTKTLDNLTLENLKRLYESMQNK